MIKFTHIFAWNYLNSYLDFKTSPKGFPAINQIMQVRILFFPGFCISVLTFLTLWQIGNFRRILLLARLTILHQKFYLRRDMEWNVTGKTNVAQQVNLFILSDDNDLCSPKICFFFCLQVVIGGYYVRNACWLSSILLWWTYGNMQEGKSSLLQFCYRKIVILSLEIKCIFNSSIKLKLIAYTSCFLSLRS